jgi:hypothetical protein
MGLALGAQAQTSMINIIGMSFIPLYAVIAPFIFFVSRYYLWSEEVLLVVTIFLSVKIILIYRVCGV